MDDKFWSARRQYPRHDVDHQADCSNDMGAILGKMLQIGAKGAFFAPESGMIANQIFSMDEGCTSIFSIGDTITFSIRLDERSETIEILATVRHISRRDGIEGIGVEFASPLPEPTLQLLTKEALSVIPKD